MVYIHAEILGHDACRDLDERGRVILSDRLHGSCAVFRPSSGKVCPKSLLQFVFGTLGAVVRIAADSGLKTSHLNLPYVGYACAAFARRKRQQLLRLSIASNDL